LNILILHRIPYHKINYHLSIDHDVHQVTYIGLAKNLANLPTHIRYQTVDRPGTGNVAEEVLAAIRSRKLAADLIISLSENELADAAKVRKTLGLPGADQTEILKMRDRLRIRQLVTQEGVRVAQAVALARFAKSLKLPWKGKTVLRDLDAGTGNDARIFDSPAGILCAIRQKTTGMTQLDQNQALLDQFEVEEYIDGDYLHFDGLVKEGRIIVMQSSQYVGNRLLYAQGQPLGSVQIDTAPADTKWAQKIIDATGIRQGAFHIELVNRAGERVFLDIANRAGGACVVDTFRMATGINLVSAELSLLLGEEIIVKIRRKSKRFGWFMFPGHHLAPGTCRITGHTAFMEHPFLLRFEIMGKTCALRRGVTYQCGTVPLSGTISATSHLEMRNWLEKMFREVNIRSAST